MPVSPPQPVWSVEIGQPTEAFWGQNVAEHVVQRFASITERQANWTSPPKGAVCVTTETNPPRTWQWDGAGWIQIGPAILARGPNNQPYTLDQRISSQITFDQIPICNLPASSFTQNSQLVNRAYVQGQLQGYVALTGDTMTGALVLHDTHGDVWEPTGNGQAVPRLYCDRKLLKSGGEVADRTVTGPPGGDGIALRVERGKLDMVGDIDMNGHVITTLPSAPNEDNKIAGDGYAVPLGYATRHFVNQPTEIVDGDASYLTYGFQPNDGRGCRLNGMGQINTSINTENDPNMIFRRGANSDAANQPFISFRIGIPGAEQGAITIRNATTVQLVGDIVGAVHAPSDYRMKKPFGPVLDAAQRVTTLARRAYRGTWVDKDPGVVYDFLNAHDVAAVAPYVVDGEKDGDSMQEVNFPGLIPLLVAALGNALGRIADLEARLA